MDGEYAALTALANRLRLTRIRDNLPDMLAHAFGMKMNPRETLEYFFSQEVQRRDANRLGMRVLAAHFPRVCTLAEFNLEAQPSIDPGVLRELATCEWVGAKRNLLIQGPAGVGKTHLAIALGREAIQKGFSVAYQELTLLSELIAKDGVSGLTWRLKQMYQADLLILDEMGYVVPSPEVSALLNDLVKKRYEAKSILVVTNSPITGWAPLIGNAATANTFLDRFLHHSEILVISGESYRLQEHKREALMRKSGTQVIEARTAPNELI